MQSAWGEGNAQPAGLKQCTSHGGRGPAAVRSLGRPPSFAGLCTRRHAQTPLCCLARRRVKLRLRMPWPCRLRSAFGDSRRAGPADAMALQAALRLWRGPA